MTRPYQERSSTVIPPQPGREGHKRQRKWWRFSSGVGAANWATRTWRGSSGATRRLIAPPLPEASQPSKTTQTGGPISFAPIWPPRVRRSAVSRSCSRLSALRSSFLESFWVRSSPSSRPIRSVPGVAGRRAGAGRVDVVASVAGVVLGGDHREGEEQGGEEDHPDPDRHNHLAFHHVAPGADGESRDHQVQVGADGVRQEGERDREVWVHGAIIGQAARRRPRMISPVTQPSSGNTTTPQSVADVKAGVEKTG